MPTHAPQRTICLLATCLAVILALVIPAASLGASTGGASGPAQTVRPSAVGGSPAASARAPALKARARAGVAPHRRSRAPITAVAITGVSCAPSGSCAQDLRKVTVRGRLLLRGRGLAPGMIVVFPHAPGAHAAQRQPVAALRRSGLGLVVSVPGTAHSGRIYVVAHGRRSNAFGPIFVVRYALHPARALTPAPAPTLALTPATGPSPFDGQGMWIWYLGKSDGGDLSSIVARAHRAGISTLFIKSSDGSTNFWSQFTPQLIQTLHANGLKVCAWQYVYGTHPSAEADLGAQAVNDGADCLVIDAEAEYEGHYGAAQAYISELRAKVGLSYPVGLASFPYVDYHPSFPYSVFLGPGGAQYNAPQMYWKDIGVSVDTVYAHTWIANRIYARPILPLGQTYNQPSRADLLRFRELANAYGAAGLSFWDYQETSSAGWAALAAPLSALPGFVPDSAYPDLGQGDKGDQVLWLQEHLATAVPDQGTDGVFGRQTAGNLASFQTAHGLPATGRSDAATWQALLALAPVTVDWTGGAPQASASRYRPGAVRRASAPASARLKARSYEIPEVGAAGGRTRP